MRRNPPALRAPNGVLPTAGNTGRRGRPFYDPAKVTAPTLLVLGEWDRDTPPAMAQTPVPAADQQPGQAPGAAGRGHARACCMERNRGALFQAVQVFLEEAAA